MPEYAKVIIIPVVEVIHPLVATLKTDDHANSDIDDGDAVRIISGIVSSSIILIV